VAAEIGGVALVGDVVSEADAIAALDIANGAGDGLRILVNCAGIGMDRPAVETSVEDFRRIVDVNLTGSFIVSRAAARLWLAQGRGGAIVNITSVSGLTGNKGRSAYGSSKGGQNLLTLIMANELGPHGIRVNGINPDGVVRGSGIFASGWGAQRAAVYGVPESELGAYYAKRTLLGREVLPEHVAAAVVALTGPDLSQTTGLHVPVDSGVAAAFLR